MSKPQGFTQIWVDYADNSYVATRLLWFTGFVFEAAVNAHRTIELYLKAYLVGQGIPVERGSPAWGHDLADLCQEAARFDPSLRGEDLRRRIAFFQRYFDYVRYPDNGSSVGDGSLIWFSFDSNIIPLDEIVAFIRPRVKLAEEDSTRTPVYGLLGDPSKTRPHQLRALKDGNDLVETINTDRTLQTIVVFNQDFEFDQTGC